MRGARYGTAVAVGFILILTLPTMGQSGMMGQGPMEQPGPMRESPPRGPSGMMGSGMMGMMEGGGMGGHMGMMEPGHMLRMLKTELALSEGQEKQLKDILYQVDEDEHQAAGRRAGRRARSAATARCRPRRDGQG